MGRIIKLTERDLTRLVKKIVKEQNDSQIHYVNHSDPNMRKHTPNAQFEIDKYFRDAYENIIKNKISTLKDRINIRRMGNNVNIAYSEEKMDYNLFKYSYGDLNLITVIGKYDDKFPSYFLVSLNKKGSDFNLGRGMDTKYYGLNAKTPSEINKAAQEAVNDFFKRVQLMQDYWYTQGR